MWDRRIAAQAVLLAVLVFAAASGCGGASPTAPEESAPPGGSGPQGEGPRDSIPTPPPPQTPPVIYLGADTVQVGGTLVQSWRLTNEGDVPFTMEWTLGPYPAWPGLPQSGDLLLAGHEARELVTMVGVPDTAAVGDRWVRLTVTRPGGLPDGSAIGEFHLIP